MARFGVYSGLCTLLNIFILVNSLPASNLENWIDQIVNNDQPALVPEQQSMPLVELSHTQVCQKAVSEVSKDIEYNKRDDTFLNVVVNVCFPGVDQENLLQLLTKLNQLKQDRGDQTSLADALSRLFDSEDESMEEVSTPATLADDQDFNDSDKRQKNLSTAIPTEAVTTETKPLTNNIQTLAPQPQQPILSVELNQVCKKVVKEISNDIKYNKRDDVFVNLAINVCFPDMNEENFLELLAMLSNLNTLDSVTTLPPTTESQDDEIPWFAGLLPETGPGQEGLPDIGVGGNGNEVSNEIGGLLAEIGPGQEGVDEAEDAGHAAEETDLPDWTDNGNWWDGMLPDIDTEEQEGNAGDSDNLDPPPLRDMDKKDEDILERLFARMLLNLDKDN